MLWEVVDRLQALASRSTCDEYKKALTKVLSEKVSPCSLSMLPRALASVCHMQMQKLNDSQEEMFLANLMQHQNWLDEAFPEYIFKFATKLKESFVSKREPGLVPPFVHDDDHVSSMLADPMHGHASQGGSKSKMVFPSGRSLRSSANSSK